MSARLTRLHAIADTCLRLAVGTDNETAREALLDMADRYLAEAALLDIEAGPVTHAVDAVRPAHPAGVPAGPGKD
jgi:hypothetical protein